VDGQAAAVGTEKCYLASQKFKRPPSKDHFQLQTLYLTGFLAQVLGIFLLIHRPRRDFDGSVPAMRLLPQEKLF